MSPWVIQSLIIHHQIHFASCRQLCYIRLFSSPCEARLSEGLRYFSLPIECRLRCGIRRWWPTLRQSLPCKIQALVLELSLTPSFQQKVYIKATEGLTYKDPSFSDHYAAATKAGFIRGGYHFAHGDESASDQAKYFADNGGGKSSCRTMGQMHPLLITLLATFLKGSLSE